MKNVVVDKSINLIGEDKDTTFIDGNKSGDVIGITADNVRISRFTVQNSGISQYDTGIKFNYGNYCTISFCIITTNEVGLCLEGVKKIPLRVKNNSIH
jgi:nitrous oxidase accessory protein NosD